MAAWASGEQAGSVLLRLGLYVNVWETLDFHIHSAISN